ncbi:SGNH hydrolase [Bimuria novae-zelandiae CBS 107.79]|uniref:SGNH hydrolase n=1 Tax=Bimuria novae-zelandiae CBS 107.79 TaxID=1447943 RepID=A0A6A5VKL9_9PLEO|nr:SGNH hydrolase [Bimuria novae-zelandiae CBS 107.79]
MEKRATPTIYLAGDSTMANKGANDGATDGWGQYLSKYVTAPVVNKAVGGRSARSYTNEGRFTDIANLIKSGDIVVIEFGHNDGGSPTTATDNGRSDCPGTGEETCKSGKDGSTVYTFGHYVKAAAKTYIAKGATVVVGSQTPNNAWEGGVFSTAAPKFVAYAAQAGKEIGTGATFVDHFQAVLNAYKKLGNAKTNAFFPNDHTHTSPAGADLVAQAFAQAIEVKLNGTTPIVPYLRSGNPTVW